MNSCSTRPRLRASRAASAKESMACRGRSSWKASIPRVRCTEQLLGRGEGVESAVRPPRARPTPRRGHRPGRGCWRAGTRAAPAGPRRSSTSMSCSASASRASAASSPRSSSSVRASVVRVRVAQLEPVAVGAARVCAGGEPVATLQLRQGGHEGPLGVDGSTGHVLRRALLPQGTGGLELGDGVTGLSAPAGRPRGSSDLHRRGDDRSIVLGDRVGQDDEVDRPVG